MAVICIGLIVSKFQLSSVDKFYNSSAQWGYDLPMVGFIPNVLLLELPEPDICYPVFRNTRSCGIFSFFKIHICNIHCGWATPLISTHERMFLRKCYLSMRCFTIVYISHGHGYNEINALVHQNKDRAAEGSWSCFFFIFGVRQI